MFSLHSFLPVAGSVAALLAFPHVFLMGTLGTAALLRRSFRFPGTGEQGSFLFVIPAHDEEEGIAATVRSCLSVEWPQSLRRVLVIADNCTDDTAGMARRAGAEVWERRDQARRSKGFALEDFFATVQTRERNSEVDAFVIVDADTRVSANLLETFNRALAHGCRWIQCHYGVSNAEASWRTRLMTYALSLFNGVWLAGQHALGMGAALRGNGMCLDAASVQRFPWRAATLAEDLEFSWRLRQAGETVAFTAECEVRGEMVARNRKASASQRLRWEVGRAALRTEFRAFVLGAPGIPFFKRLLWALDLHSWPLARVAMTLLVAIVTTIPLAALFPSPMSWALALLVAFETLALVTYMLAPFLVLGLPWRYLATLLVAPLYLLWKLSLLFVSRPRGWVRTEREHGRGESS